MIRPMTLAVSAALLYASTPAYADDPTALLLQWRRETPTRQAYDQAPPQFSDVGPCGPGTHSIAFPNWQGFRCVPNRQ
jgi:hypothetical protein